VAAKKDAAVAERQARELEKEATKQQKTTEKRDKQRGKLARAELAKCKKKHKELWSLKNVKALGDKLHVAIHQNALVEGYKAPYCGFISQVCKNNQHIAIERRRARKRGENTSHLPPLQKVRPQVLNTDGVHWHWQLQPYVQPFVHPYFISTGSMQHRSAFHAMALAIPARTHAEAENDGPSDTTNFY